MREPERYGDRWYMLPHYDTKWREAWDQGVAYPRKRPNMYAQGAAQEALALKTGRTTIKEFAWPYTRKNIFDRVAGSKDDAVRNRIAREVMGR